MAIKNNKIKLEKLLMNVYYVTNKGKNIETDEQAAVIIAIRKTLGVLNILENFDENNHEDGIKHTSIFKAIYFKALIKKNKRSKKRIIVKKRKTKIGFAEELFISEASVGRYTDKYIYFFERYLNDPTFDMPELD